MVDKKLLEVDVFPDPAQDEINIKIEQNYVQETFIAVYDPMGELLKKATVNAKNHVFDIRNLKPGYYFVFVTAGHLFATKKFFKPGLY